MLKALCISLSIIGGSLMALEIESSAFAEGDTIPIRYTSDGKDLSPPLFFNNIPPNTKSLVLIVDDPDAPSSTWDHWVLFNLPPDTVELPEGIFNREILPNGAIQGLNSFGKTGYNGPSPPKGSKPHRYFFKLYALDIPLPLNAKAKKMEVETAMHGHILAQAELMGHFSH